MYLFDMLEEKYRSIAKLCGTTLAITTFLIGCSSGGGSSTPPPPPPQDVSISGKVYDQEISGATVEILVGDTVVGTTTSDSSGQYSFDLSVTEAQRAQRCVVRATRGNFSLQSLLGTVGAVTDSRDENDEVNGDNLPAANVTNVSTALAAIIQRENGGTLPSDQSTIDNLIDSY